MNMYIYILQYQTGRDRNETESGTGQRTAGLLGLLQEGQLDHTCNHSHRFNELATKSENGMESPDWHTCDNV